MKHSDEIDRANDYAERWRESAIQNALLVGADNPMRGASICPNCKGRNDRAKDGFDICSACVEDPDWWK